MSQRFEVRLLDAGSNRLSIMARVRPLLGVSPQQCRSLVEAGHLVVVRDHLRDSAEGLAAEMRRLGARAEVAICSCGCSDGPDAFD